MLASSRSAAIIATTATATTDDNRYRRPRRLRRSGTPSRNVITRLHSSWSSSKSCSCGTTTAGTRDGCLWPLSDPLGCRDVADCWSARIATNCRTASCGRPEGMCSGRITGSPPNHAGTGRLAGNTSGNTSGTSAMVNRRRAMTN
jgi:hypothetical protein